MNKRRISQRQQEQRRKQTKRAGGGTGNMPWIIGGIVIGAVLLVGLIILLNQSTKAPQATLAGQVATKEWPQAKGSVLGPDDAPVNIVVFSDFQCPYCKLFTTTVQPQIIDQYVKTGKVRMEYRHFIVIDSNVGGTESRHAAEASECASEQGHFWDYHELLFSNQAGEGSGAFSDANLKKFAQQLGLDTAKFNSCLSSGQYANKVKVDEAQGRTLGVNGTPAVFINGKLVNNPIDWNIVKTAIDNAMSTPTK